MMRSLRAVLATAVLMAALVTVSSAAAASTPQAKTTPVKQWTSSVCTGFARWETRLTKLSSRGTVADPVAGKAAITKYVAGALKATDKLAGKVESAGAPSVKNGKAIDAALLTSVEGVRGAYEKAETDAAALPTGDAGAFSFAAQALGATLQTASTTLSSTLTAAVKSTPGSALDKAFTTTKSCAALT
jgi:hypothetical protein